jgi:hypothetical protein
VFELTREDLGRPETCPQDLSPRSGLPLPSAVSRIPPSLEFLVAGTNVSAHSRGSVPTTSVVVVAHVDCTDAHRRRLLGADERTLAWESREHWSSARSIRVHLSEPVSPLPPP